MFPNQNMIHNCPLCQWNCLNNFNNSNKNPFYMNQNYFMNNGFGPNLNLDIPGLNISGKSGWENIYTEFPYFGQIYIPFFVFSKKNSLFNLKKNIFFEASSTILLKIKKPKDRYLDTLISIYLEITIFLNLYWSLNNRNKVHNKIKTKE